MSRQEIELLREKIIDLITKDPEGLRKAVTVLTEWLNQPPQEKRKKAG